MFHIYALRGGISDSQLLNSAKDNVASIQTFIRWPQLSGILLTAESAESLHLAS